ncbi:hypothetical protein [Pseudomonas sp. JZ134]|uniref:hypothetical protein n=1 Tax=Pseudomonas sp. JZ134 TaxID=2806615 RepID=UPI003DA11971
MKSNIKKRIGSDTEKELSLKSFLIKVFADLKWLIAIFSLLLSILTLSKYLWVIDHPDLLMASISTGPKLFVWLLFVVIGMLCYVFIMVIPSTIFGFTLSFFNVSPFHLGKLANRLLVVVWVGFAVLSLALASYYFINLPMWSVALGIFLISIIGTSYITLFSRKSYIAKIGDRKNKKMLYFQRSFFILFIAFLLALTTLMGIFPAQNTIWAWRGPEEGWKSFGVIACCFFSMLISLVPVTAFYTMPGNSGKRATKAIIGTFMVIFLTAMLTPALLDNWIYTAANILKLKDDKALPYLINPKDYPYSTFDKEIWEIDKTDSKDKLFTINAFKLYSFDDILLLCPGKYSKTPLKYISIFTSKCFTTTSSKVKPAAPRGLRYNGNVLLGNLPDCLSKRIFTKVPFKLSEDRVCIFTHPL